MTKAWAEPEVVSLCIEATMSSITPKETYDALYHDIMKSEDNPEGYFFEHKVCS